MLDPSQSHRVAPGRRRYQFFSSRPFSALLSNNASAPRVPSTGGSRPRDYSRFASGTAIPPYLARHV